jgi:inner membrane protein
MTGKTHLIIGIGAGLLMVHYLPQPTLLLTAATIAVVGVGALLPDIDSPESTINSWIPPLRLLTLFFKHRGILHTVFIPIILTLIGFVYPQVNHWLLALSIGYWSHLAADCMTVQGLFVLYPVPFKVHLLPYGLRISTGGIVEHILMLGLICGMAYYLYGLGMALWT